MDATSYCFAHTGGTVDATSYCFAHTGSTVDATSYCSTDSYVSFLVSFDYVLICVHYSRYISGYHQMPNQTITLLVT